MSRINGGDNPTVGTMRIIGSLTLLLGKASKILLAVQLFKVNESHNRIEKRLKCVWKDFFPELRKIWKEDKEMEK
jgi:hypothetical protein